MHNKFFSKYYFIDKFDKNHLEKLDRSIHIIYRQKKNNENFKIIKNILKYCRKKNIKFYLANNFKLAIKLDLDGVYISAFNRDTKHNCYSLKKKFKIIGSAHNIYEINLKKHQKVECFFLSSVFKKKSNYLKIYGFMRLNNFIKKKSFALGGVSTKHLNLLKFIGSNGFAGINIFEKKRPLKN